MNKIKKINGHNIPSQVEYENRIVLTTKQLAEFYDCSEKRISENFNRNKERFAIGKHYCKLDKDNGLPEFKATNPQFADRSSVLYLWTKQGSARHAKMLGTDMASQIIAYAIPA